MENLTDLRQRIDEVNTNLQPHEVLKNFNAGLTKKHRRNTGAAQSYRVFEEDELFHLPEDYFGGDVFFLALKEMLADGDRENIALICAAYLLMERDTALREGTVLCPESPTAMLRRTAAILYKNMRVPCQTLLKGEFKTVQGPIGIEVADEYEGVERIIESIGPVWNWDGNFPDQGGRGCVREKNHLVYVSANPENADGEAAIQDEMYIMEKLGEVLRHPAYLPRVYHATNHGRYIESIEQEFQSGTTKEKVVDVLNAGLLLSFLWKKTGLIFSDVKKSNFRKRRTGEVVIVDLGSRYPGQPMMETVDVRYLEEYTPAFILPEKLDLAHAETPEIQTEPIIVFQMGVLLIQALYSEIEIRIVLENCNGKKWPPMIDSLEETYSVNHETVTALANRFGVELPEDIYVLASAALRDNPEDRPTLQTVINRLRKVLRKIK